MPSLPPLHIGKIGKAGINGNRFSVLSLSPSLWLDASDSDTITHSAGFVSQWNDKSGNNRHASQAIGDKQPITSARTLNGLNVIDLDGADDMLDFDGSFVAGSDYTLIAVDETDRLTNNYILGGTQGGANLNLHFGHVDADTFKLAQYSNDLNGNHSSLSAPSANIWVGRLNESSHALFRGSEGLLASNANITPLTSWNGSNIGFYNLFYFDGGIGEILVFNRGLSNGEINHIGKYLSKKWNIAWTNI